MPETERQLRSRLRELSRETAQVTKALNEKKRDKRIKCSKCGRGTRVRKLVYIQTHWYVTPYSCTGGDYWKEGEGQYDCPKCGHRNRLYKRPEVVALKRFFDSVVKTHDD